jgi:hypothetical protein
VFQCPHRFQGVHTGHHQLPLAAMAAATNAANNLIIEGTPLGTGSPFARAHAYMRYANRIQVVGPYRQFHDTHEGHQFSTIPTYSGSLRQELSFEPDNVCLLRTVGAFYLEPYSHFGTPVNLWLFPFTHRGLLYQSRVHILPCSPRSTWESTAAHTIDSADCRHPAASASLVS